MDEGIKHIAEKIYNECNTRGEDFQLYLLNQCGVEKGQFDTVPNGFSIFKDHLIEKLTMQDHLRAKMYTRFRTRPDSLGKHQ